MAPRLTETYRKDTLHKPGHGYGRNIGSAVRPNWVAERGFPLSTVVVHTTNNQQKDTKPWNEATFIRDSPDVSCHDLIFKDGTIAVILPPYAVAWHAGVALRAFTNINSYGIELHCSVGEKPTQAQIDSLTWRVRDLIGKYSIPKANIETHRAVALPAGRKTDPEGWDNDSFYSWRARLFLPAEPDWQQEWGFAVPYRKDWGIPQAYRDSYRKGTPLGHAVTDEVSITDYTMQAFEHGYILYSPDHGTEVRAWRG
jgi:hypothetical protein